MQDLQAAFRSISSSVSGFLNVNPVLNEACENSSTPTPGYLYKDIADMTFESTDTCMRILDFLCEKLDDSSPVVKYKALNVVKNVLQKGSPAFFREMGRKHMAVRECLNFRGPPDPLHGDAPYAQVRDLAQQVTNMLFDTQPTFTDAAPGGNPYALSNSANAPRGSFEPVTQTPPPMSSVSSHPTSFSSTHTTSSIPSSNYRVSTTVDGGRRVYVNSAKAIGSYVEYQPSRLETFVDKMSEGFDSFKASLVGNTKPEPSPARPYGYGSSAGGVAPNLSTSSRYTTGDVSALDALNGGGGDVSSFVRSDSGPSLRASLNQIAEFSRPTSSIIDSWEYKLVSQLTPHTGRPALARAEISDFVQKTSQLASNASIITIIEALLVRIIVPDQWQCKLKALYLVEALLKSDISNSRELLRPHLRLLAEQSRISVQASFKEKVQTVLSLYPLSERPDSPATAAFQQPSPTSTRLKDDAGGLFDGLNEHSAPVEPVSLIDLDFTKPAVALVRPSHQPPHQHSILVPQTTEIPTRHNTDSLFDGLDTADSASSQPKPSPGPSTDSLLLDFGAPVSTSSTSTQSNNVAPVRSMSDLERDFFSQPASTHINDPLATLGQLQTARAPLTATNSPTAYSDDLGAQIAILRGRRTAIESQIEIVKRDHPHQQAYVTQLTAQLHEVTAQISFLSATSAYPSANSMTTTTNSSGLSLEALYRQQPSHQGTTIDYNALQTSHRNDPFEFMRHDMRQ